MPPPSIIICRLLGCLVMASIVATGCRSAGGASVPTPTRLRAPEYAAPELVLAGFTVESFARHSDLTSWVRSRQLIEAACRTWLGVPAARSMTIDNPSRATLQRYLTVELPARLEPGQLVLFYIGTHQLADGRVLLAGGDSVTTSELADWLGALPAGRLVLLADICYARSLEQANAFGEGVMRLYASLDDEKAPDIPLDGSLREIKGFFAETDATIRRELGMDHDHFSLFGYLFVHALLQQRLAGAEHLRMDQLYTLMDGERQKLAPKLRRIRMPAFAVRNPQPWVLASASAKRHDLESLFKLPPAQVDPGLGNLLIGKHYEPETDVEAGLAELDRMAQAVRQRLGTERRPTAVVQILNHYLFEELGLQAVEEPYPADFMLHGVLTERRGRCSSLVSLYQALGYRLGIDFRSFCIPEHIFIRWVRQPGSAWDWPDGQHYLNIETTRQGIALPDERYEQLPNWTMTREGRTFYLQPLDARQTLATLFAPLANALLHAGHLDEAEVAGRRAIELHPGDAEAWNILGSIRRRQNLLDLATLCYRRALDIHPGFAEAWNNLGTLTADPDQQIEHYKTAVKLKPELGEAWGNLARAQATRHQYGLAWASIQRCQALGYHLPDDLVRTVRQHLQK